MMARFEDLDEFGCFCWAGGLGMLRAFLGSAIRLLLTRCCISVVVVKVSYYHSHG